MDGDAITLTIFAIAGVVFALLYVLKGVFDQVPEVIDSASRARDAWKRFKQDDTPPPLPRRDDEPPAAA